MRKVVRLIIEREAINRRIDILHSEIWDYIDNNKHLNDDELKDKELESRFNEMANLYERSLDIREVLEGR